jgi:hypothetical protein
MAYDKTNSGALFKNEDKRGDTFPDYKGNININGQDFWLSAWLKVSNDGTKRFMSLSVQPKQAPAPAQRSAPAPRKAPSQDAAKARQLPRQDDDFNDEPPF